MEETFWDRVRIFLSSPTVVDLAAMLDVKRSTLSGWIHNDRRPPMEILLKISELTGVSIAQLEYGLDYQSDEEDEVAESVERYRREVDTLIDGLADNELRLLRALLPYLKNPPPLQGS